MKWKLKRLRRRLEVASVRFCLVDGQDPSATLLTRTLAR